MAAKADKSVDPVDQLSAAYTDPRSQKLVTKELGKAVLSKGAWATVLFLVQDLDEKTGDYRPPKVSVRRYKRAGQAYRFHSAFSISGEKQARAMVEVVEQWFGKGGPGRAAMDALGAAAHLETEE